MQPLFAMSGAVLRRHLVMTERDIGVITVGASEWLQRVVSRNSN
jgi:hypothetical protein